MKKTIILIIISVALLFLNGCSNVDNKDMNLTDDTLLEINDFKVKTSSQNHPQEISLKESNHPSDIRIFNDKLYLIEKEPNVIKKYDFQGNLEDTYRLGENKVPTVFTMSDEYIFVYDSLGNKVTLLNHQFEELKEIMLEQLQFNANYIDIEVFNDRIVRR